MGLALCTTIGQSPVPVSAVILVELLFVSSITHINPEPRAHGGNSTNLTYNDIIQIPSAESRAYFLGKTPTFAYGTETTNVNIHSRP